MQLYVMRHGQTHWNVQNRVCGKTDTPLTEEGIRQAHAAATAMQPGSIDLIIASPLQRAQQTAHIISDACQAPVCTDNRLIEQDYGVFEGIRHQDPAFLANKRQFACRYPEGESMMMLAARVYPMLEELKTRQDVQNVLLVTHGAVCRVIHSYFTDLSNEEYFSYNAGNCSLQVYTLT